MGHFSIQLTNGNNAEVRWGTIRKKSLLLNFFGLKNRSQAIRKGYIVKLFTKSSETQEYQLMKDWEGVWVCDNAPGFDVSLDDPTVADIKRAIDSYEVDR